MKRKIKFRGKRLDNGEWVYGDLLHPATSCRIVSYTPAQDSPHGSVGVDYHYHDIDPATVGQYTGLKDRGGREIYEGDVVRFHFMCASTDIPKSGLYPTEEFIGIVTLDAYFHTCILSNKMEIHIENAVKYGEVIGNIHDNPDFTKTRER